ncbi:hypothetical protein SF23_15600 [Streptomyces sp. MBRL 10]|nr:hypothetical protein SF23_15600 [Streptomyces sp. MBRL 10]
MRIRSKKVKKRITRTVTPVATHSAIRVSAAATSRRPSTGTPAGTAAAGVRRSPVTVNQSRTQAATAELPYCRKV